MRNQEKICVAFCAACTALSLYSTGYANGSASVCAQKTEIAYVEETIPATVCTTVPEEPTTVPTEPEETTEAAEPPTEAPTEPPEFPEAQYIWDFLKSHGFSDIVSAGIMGNMMAEVGGCTLKIRPELYDPPRNYYGICQWNKWYYPEVQGKPLDFQLDFLMDTIHSRFTDSNYEKFVNSDNPRIAARRFAIWYEGCAEWSYSVRESNAQKAYDYFVEVN